MLYVLYIYNISTLYIYICCYCSVAQSCPTLWPHGLQHRQASLSFTFSWNLLKLMSTESLTPFNHLVLCHPLFLLPSIFPSIRVFFQWVGSSHQVANVLDHWPFQSSALPMNSKGLFPLGLTDLISLMSKESLLQYHSLKAILRYSAFSSCLYI